MYSNLLFLLGAMLPAALANPMALNATEYPAWRRDAAKGTPNVYVCPDYNFKGTKTVPCSFFFPDPTFSPCLSLGYKPMSIGPDKGIVCTLFRDNGCHSSKNMYYLNNPGNGDLQGMSGMSLKCKWGKGGTGGPKPDPVPANNVGIEA